MKLLQSLETIITDHSLSKAEANDYKGLRKSLSQYLDGTDCDMLRLAQPDWTDGYYKFLCQAYQSNKQRAEGQDNPAAMRYLKTLRKFVNRATADCNFPDLDIFEGTQVHDAMRRQRRKAPASLKSLLGQPARQGERLLNALYLAGLDPQSLSDQAFDSESNTIRLPHLNARLAYPEHLFEKLRQKREAYDRESAFVIFLNYAIAIGESATARRAIDLKLARNKCAKESDITGLQRVTDHLVKHFDPHTKHWYAVRTHGITGTEARHRIMGGLMGLSLRPGEIYVPHTPQRAMQRQRVRLSDPSRTLRNVLFVKTYRHDIGVFDSPANSTSVYGDMVEGRKHYRAVPEMEIRTLQLVLRSLGCDCQQDSEMVSKLPPLSLGQDVMLHVPNFQGYRGTVLRLNDDGSYDLAVEAASCKIEIEEVPRELITAAESH